MLRVSSMLLPPRVGLQSRACMSPPWTRYAIISRLYSSKPSEQKPTRTASQENDNSKNADQAAAVLPHFADRSSENQPRQTDDKGLTWDHPVPHPVYDMEIIREIPQTHHGVAGVPDRVAFGAVWLLRRGFDFVSRYRGPGGGMTEQAWLNRCLFLETVAGVPGMVGGMTRHLHSLRRMRRDYGWIHTLLEEAENERMHLIIFMNLKQPGPLMRAMVLAAQGVFFNLFFLSYLVSPRTCHRFVGYLEEEAVKTYTGLLADIQHNRLLAHWQTQTAPVVARTYYKLPETASLADMVLCIRADEANHRDVNHTFAALNQDHDVNPFIRRQAAQDKQSRA